jgi:hypothetical protein
MSTTTQTETIASLYANLEALTARCAELNAAEAYSGSGDDPLEIADGAWTETSLKILMTPAKSLGDIVLQLKTLVEKQVYPNCGTDEDVAAVFHKNALAFLESN